MRKQFLFVLLSLATMLLCSPAVVYAQWEPDVRLTYNDSASSTAGMSSTPNWGIAASGDTVHVVWHDYRDGYSSGEIYYKRSTDGGVSWGPDLRLTYNPRTSYDAKIAVRGPAVHLVWNDGRDRSMEIFYKRSMDGGATWESDVKLSYDSSFTYSPSLSVSGSNVYVVQHTYRDGNYEIYFLRSTDEGVTWNGNTRLTSDTAFSGFPSVASSGSNVHIVWEDDRNANSEIFYKCSTDRGSTWGSDRRLTFDPAPSRYPVVSIADSMIHVIWAESRDGNGEVYYIRSTDKGISWGAETRLTSDPADSYISSIAASGLNVHVVWCDTRDGNREIYYKSSTDGGASWGSDTRLTYATETSFLSSVAVSGTTVHLVWTDYRDCPPSWPEIYYKRNPTGNIGVEESAGLSDHRIDFRLKPIPNPFTSFATVPGHSSDRFALYDISGRRVGVYRGDRIGEGLAAGVYFIKAEGKGNKPLRVVKVR
jgi:hypothetical protein